MSAIFGKCNFDNKPLDMPDMQAMQSRLNHWQCDKADTWLSGCTGMGHLMLYNTPQSLAESQPFYDSLSDLCITADARLDNHDELFKLLDIQQQAPLLMPDSLLIMKTYQKYGFNCVKYLVGDFAFALYDAKQQLLFCARDHLGVKPFFYYSCYKYIAFASEKKGIMALPDADQSLNKQFLYNHIIFPSEQTVEDTLYQHIKKLKPAHTLTVNLANRTTRSEKYWEPDIYTELKFNDRNDYYEGLRHYFEQAVKCRLVSAHPVGVELSGGMDSSAITGAASTFFKQQNKQVFTLSNTLPDDITDPEITKLDERRYIDSVIKHFDIKDPIYITRPLFDNTVDELKFAMEINDGLERWNPLWQLPLKNAAMNYGIRTLLSGFPGDELVTYRGKYYFLDYLDKKQYLKYLLAPKKYPGFSKLEPLFPFPLRHSISKIKKALGLYHGKTKHSLNIYNIPKTYKKHLRDPYWHDIYFQEQFNSYRHYQRYRIFKPQVTHRLESETRFGIHFRTEPRFPMADIRLIQYYLSMPNYLKYEGQMARTAFRKAIGRYLPPLILQRNDKYGSTAPFLNINKQHFAHESKALIEQLPDVSFLKKQLYQNTANKPAFYPTREVMVWLIENKHRLDDFME